MPTLKQQREKILQKFHLDPKLYGEDANPFLREEGRGAGGFHNLEDFGKSIQEGILGGDKAATERHARQGVGHVGENRQQAISQRRRRRVDLKGTTMSNEPRTTLEKLNAVMVELNAEGAKLEKLMGEALAFCTAAAAVCDRWKAEYKLLTEKRRRVTEILQGLNAEIQADASDWWKAGPPDET